MKQDQRRRQDPRQHVRWKLSLLDIYRDSGSTFEQNHLQILVRLLFIPLELRMEDFQRVYFAIIFSR